MNQVGFPPYLSRAPAQKKSALRWGNKALHTLTLLHRKQVEWLKGKENEEERERMRGRKQIKAFLTAAASGIL